MESHSSPTGGWTDIVSFGSATSIDPTAIDARGTLGLTADQEQLLATCSLCRLRTSTGDDAACTNLYATLRPTVLGVGRDFIERGGFRFLAQAEASPPRANPWQLLEQPQADGAFPVILDQATAQWALKLGGIGARFLLPDDQGGQLPCVIVGLLEPGILQGLVLVSEQRFQQMFPDRSGYGMALVDASRLPPADRPALRTALATAWADAGVSISSAAERLASLLAVQNTFLAGFQVLGSLGLLLGTAGVAAVQLQGVLERVGPLAVLRAVGFTAFRLRLVLILETLVTVLLGIMAGIGAACLAVAPALAGGEAQVPLRWIAITTALSLTAAVLAAVFAASRTVVPIRPPAE